ncbi:MAG TPA: alpha/beta hydrolase [Pseudonocardiaceae bacterium]|nr:alpha/beta hydrolase [Pseudonocardiaceae bacterium]
MTAPTDTRPPQVIETACGPVECSITEGTGPVVLASHGGIGGIDQARLMLNWLDPNEYRLLSCSRPGYLGTPLSSGRTFEQQADLFAALLDALGVHRAAVVTLSAGGPAGYLLAARHPDRVSALVAISSVTGRYDMPETAGRFAQAMFLSHRGQQLTQLIARRWPAWLLRQTFQGTAHYTARQLAEHMDHALSSPDGVAFLRALIGTMNPYRPRIPGNDNDMTLFGDLDPLPLHHIRCPTLIVHGTHDADVKFCHGVRAHEEIPGAHRVWIEDGSHLGFWLSPHAAQAQDAAREFLDRTTRNEAG